MAWVVVTRDAEGRLLSRLALADRPLTIGRDGDRDIVLASSSVSRRHARYELRPEGPLFVDEGSANGSRLDGRVVSGSVAVDEHNVVEIAGFRLTVEQIEGHQADQGLRGVPTERSGDSRPSLAPEPQGPTRIADGTLLLVPVPVEGSPALDVGGRPIPLRPGEWIVGRGAQCELVLDDASISRRHARLVVDAEGRSVELFDLGSVNGLFINGARLDRGHARAGDRIRLGERVFCLMRDLVPSSRERLRVWAPPMVALGVALIGLIMASVLGVSHRIAPAAVSKPLSASDGRRALDERFAEIAHSLAEGRDALAAESWAKATSAFDRVLALDPLNEEAARLRADVERDQRVQSLLTVGEQQLATGSTRDRGDGTSGSPSASKNSADASSLWRTVQQLGAVSRESRYYQQAQDVLKRSRPQLTSLLLTTAKERCAKRDDVACQRALCRFFSTEGEHLSSPASTSARQLLRDAERRLGAGSARIRPCAAPSLRRDR